MVARHEIEYDNRTITTEAWRYSTSDRFVLRDDTGTVLVSTKLLEKALHADDDRWNNMALLQSSTVDPPRPGLAMGSPVMWFANMLA